MQADIKFPSMAEIGSDRMSTYYEIDAGKIDSFSAFICGSGAVPDEIAVFKMKSEQDVEAAKSVLLARVDNQKATFESYTPDEMYKFDDKNVAEYVCFRLNIWAKDKLYDLEAEEEVDGFCDYFYQTGYEQGVRDTKFYM